MNDLIEKKSEKKSEEENEKEFEEEIKAKTKEEAKGEIKEEIKEEIKTEGFEEKRTFYAKRAKIAVVAVALASALAAGTVGGFMVAGSVWGTYESDRLVVESYESSAEAAFYLEEMAQELFASLEQTDYYVDGVLQEDLKVNLADYTDGLEIGTSEKYLTYRLGDLLDFYESDGYAYLEWLVFNAEELQAAAEFVSDEPLGEDAEELWTQTVYHYEVSGAAEDGEDMEGFFTFEAYRHLFNVYYHNGQNIEENYSILSAKGTSLAEYAYRYSNVVSVMDCYLALYEAVEEVSDSVNAANTTLESNLLLYICNLDTGDSYTNIDAMQDADADAADAWLAELGTDAGYYLRGTASYNASAAASDAVYYGDEEEFNNEEYVEINETESEGNVHLQTTGTWVLQYACANLFGEGEYLVYIGLDTSYPALDDASVSSVIFEQFGESMLGRFGFPLLLVLMIVCVIFLVLGTRQAGRTEDGQIRTLKEDRTPFELRVIIDVVCWEILLVVLSDIYHGSGLYEAVWGSESIQEAANAAMQGVFRTQMAGGAAACAAAALLLWDLKFYKRRIKSRHLGSLLVKWVQRLRLVTAGWREEPRIVLQYAGFTVVNLILMALVVYMFFEYAPVALWIVLAVLVVFDVFILIRLFRQAKERELIRSAVARIGAGDLDTPVDPSGMLRYNREIALALNEVKTGLRAAVQSEMRHERMKTELITNVSHDIKTPLTSIINYIDILKQEDLSPEDREKSIDALDRKSQRLRCLLEDLVESAKISSGNIELDLMRIDFKQLLLQENGEYEEIFEKADLELISTLPQEALPILADGMRLSRVIDNLYNNAAKYAMPGTRVYVECHRMQDAAGDQMVCTIKNVSKNSLNFDAGELMERFVRGDLSRGSEGSGLGLEIARNLTTLQGGTFDLTLDGDLFKVTLTFPLLEEEEIAAVGAADGEA